MIQRSQVRYQPEVDKTPVLGSDPSGEEVLPGELLRKSKESFDKVRPRKVTSAFAVMEHFEHAYADARRGTALPPYVWENGQRRAFMGWVKNTYLPSLDGDVDLAKAMIDYFLAHPIQPLTNKRAIWRQLSTSQDKIRVFLRNSGYRTAEEEEQHQVRLRKAEERERRQEEHSRQFAKQRRLEQMKAVTAPPRLVSDQFLYS